MSTIKVGLDLGTHSLKLIELAQDKKQYKIVKACFRQLPTKVGVQDIIMNLKHLVQDSAPSTEMMRTSVSGNEVITRFVSFPLMNKQKLIQSLKFDFEKYVPFSINESYTDVDIFSEDKENNTMEVFIVSAHKDLIDERMNIIKGAQLKPAVISADSLALYKLFCIQKPKLAHQACSIILNIGCIKSNLILIYQGHLKLIRDMPLGGENFSHTIADSLNIGQAQAEEMKLAATDDSFLKNANVELNTLVNALQMTIDYLQERENVTELFQVYLCGGSAKFTGLVDYLFEKVGMPVEIWDPFDGFDIESGHDVIEQHGPEMAVALANAVM